MVVASDGGGFLDLLKEQPLLVEALFGLVIFVAILLAFRRARIIAEELERRRELGDYVRGLDEFLRGDHVEARKTLERVLERDPENMEARIALGDCYRELGDPAEAKKHHHHVHRVFGHDLARNFVSLGRDELALQNYDAAVEAFGSALDASPDDRDARAGLARAYADGGNPVEAAEQLRRLYPDGPAAGLGVAERRAASRRFAEAGAAMVAEGDAEGAVKLFTEALAFQPGSIRARTGLVRAAHGLGDRDRARRLVEEHVAELKRLAKDDRVVFEPVAPRPPPEADETPGDSYLPARVEDVSAVVADVERKTARYLCAHCGALLREYAGQCPRCEAVGRVAPLAETQSLYLMPVDDFRAAIDEVDESAAFLQRLARDGSLGDEKAMARLVEKGPSILYEIFNALPLLEARRFLGVSLAGAFGPEAAIEVRQCHAARGGGLGIDPGPYDEFAAAFYLALGDDNLDVFLASLGEAQDAAVAGVMCDIRIPEAVRDAAARRLQARGQVALVPTIQALAVSADAGAVDRGVGILREGGPAAVALLEKRFLQATLLGRILRSRKGTRRRVVADLLAQSGLPAAVEALARAAAREKDANLRAHYVAAHERAVKGGSP